MADSGTLLRLELPSSGDLDLLALGSDQYGREVLAASAHPAGTGASDADAVIGGAADFQTLDIGIGAASLGRRSDDGAARANLQPLDAATLLVGAAGAQSSRGEDPLYIAFPDGQGWVDVESYGHDVHIQRMAVVFEL